MDQKSIDVLNKEFFPMFKVVFEDTYRFRDVDSDYLLDSEPHELLRKGHKALIFIMESYGEDWKVLYDDLSFDIVEASVEIREIKEKYSYWKSIFVDQKPVMFIYENQVFKDPYVMMDQLCVSGDPIEPHKYYTDGDGVKVSFFKSYVRPIPEGTVLIHAEQIYFNGELLYTKEELEALNVRTYLSSEIVKFIEESIPEATHYEAEMESGSLFKKEPGVDVDGV